MITHINIIDKYIYMKFIKDTWINFISNENTKKELLELFKPLSIHIYNELYIYLWIFCFIIVILFLIILANAYLLLKIYNKTIIIEI